MTEARAIVARGLFVGNVESTSPEQPGDASYARSLLDMCFVCGGNDGLWPVEDGTPSKRHLLANELLQFVRAPWRGFRYSSGDRAACIFVFV